MFSETLYLYCRFEVLYGKIVLKIFSDASHVLCFYCALLEDFIWFLLLEFLFLVSHLPLHPNMCTYMCTSLLHTMQKE